MGNLRDTAPPKRRSKVYRFRKGKVEPLPSMILEAGATAFEMDILIRDNCRPELQVGFLLPQNPARPA